MYLCPYFFIKFATLECESVWQNFLTFSVPQKTFADFCAFSCMLHYMYVCVCVCLGSCCAGKNFPNGINIKNKITNKTNSNNLCITDLVKLFRIVTCAYTNIQLFKSQLFCHRSTTNSLSNIIPGVVLVVVRLIWISDVRISQPLACIPRLQL